MDISEDYLVTISEDIEIDLSETETEENDDSENVNSVWLQCQFCMASMPILSQNMTNSKASTMAHSKAQVPSKQLRLKFFIFSDHKNVFRIFKTPPPVAREVLL